MSNFIDQRLKLLSIDNAVKAKIEKIRPVIYENFDDILAKFYKHIMSFPSGEKIFKDNAMLVTLPEKQKAHWIALFSCKFDDAYQKNSMNIGRVHFKYGVAPYLYIAGYNFFQCELIKVITFRHASDPDLCDMLTALTKLVALDMDIALSAYTREYWQDTPQREAS